MVDISQAEQELMGFLKSKSEVETIAPTMNFRDDLGLDSVDLTELIFLLEDLMGELIDDSELPRLTTVGNAIEFLREKGAVQ